MDRELTPNCSACEHRISEKACMKPIGKRVKGYPTMWSRNTSEKTRSKYDKKNTREFAGQESGGL